MDISIIIPTFKPKDYIWQCLESIYNQDLPFQNFEVLIVLNGPKEPYFSSLTEFIDTKLNALNVSLLYTDINGVSNARNIGLNNASGKFIGFIDDDDYVSPHYLSSLLQNVSTMGVAISDTISFVDNTKYYDYSCILHKKYLQLSSVSKPFTLISTRKFFNGPCMKLIDRDIIGDRRFNLKFKNGEDNLFMFLISNRVRKISFATNEAIYYRRIRENSAITRKRTFASRFKNIVLSIRQYLIYFSKDIKHYNFMFLLTRILAEFKSLFIHM